MSRSVSWNQNFRYPKHLSGNLAEQTQILKPFEKWFFDFVRENCDAKIMYHGCGRGDDVVGDLIETGVEALNPVQISAIKDLSELKRRYGRQISFWGGIDTQHVLTHRSPQNVETEVRRRILQLAPEGGYVLAAVHSMQPDVPAKNIVAMGDAAQKHGAYPMRTDLANM
jgi:uroporphyrinogen decarboxylase